MKVLIKCLVSIEMWLFFWRDELPWWHHFYVIDCQFIHLHVWYLNPRTWEGTTLRWTLKDHWSNLTFFFNLVWLWKDVFRGGFAYHYTEVLLTGLLCCSRTLGRLLVSSHSKWYFAFMEHVFVTCVSCRFFIECWLALSKCFTLRFTYLLHWSSHIHVLHFLGT